MSEPPAIPRPDSRRIAVIAAAVAVAARLGHERFILTEVTPTGPAATAARPPERDPA